MVYQQEYKISGNDNLISRSHQIHDSNQKDLMIARIMFLKKFSEEIIKNLSKQHESRLRIETEKIKKKFIDIEKEHPEYFKKMINHKILHPFKYSKEIQKEKKKIILKKPLHTHILSHPTIVAPSNILKPQDIDIEKVKLLESIKPEYKPKPQDFVLGKLENLLQDNMIQAIECLGPGKNILVKKLNRVNVTKISLSQEEINAVISEFSNKAKIPLLGGILKAAVGDLLISAVTSDFAGSRFIINRINPIYNLH